MISNKKRKIGVLTGTRAEYGLLYWVIKAIHEDPDLDLQLYVTGMHLSPEFGLTFKEIENDNFPIHKKVEILLSSDTAVGTSKAMGLAMISFSETFAEEKPDLLIVLGDRFETFAAVQAAAIALIPVAHCHGGEISEGAIDESFRHCITKLSHVHFTSTDEYRQRVIQLGEQPNKIFHVGALAIENVYRIEYFSRAEFEQMINFKLNKRNILVTYHPVTLEGSSTGPQFMELLNALEQLEDTNIIFTYPNADMFGRKIIDLINEFCNKYPDRSIAFQSLGRKRYLSALKFMDMVVGNSSSGIVEVPSFNIPTIDIGDRQKGRIKAESIIDCEPESHSIINAIKKAYSADFQEGLQDVKNPYDNGCPSEKIVSTILSTDLTNIIKKSFYNIPVR